MPFIPPMLTTRLEDPAASRTRATAPSRSSVVTGGSADGVRWGDWGEAVLLAFRYTHPRTGADVEIRQAVRAPHDLPFDLTIGQHLALVCWGVMPSGMLRHPVWASPR